MKKRVCLVTGANGAIGRAVTEEFALELDTTVIACDINTAKIPSKENIVPCRFDVTDEEEIIKIFDDIKDRFGQIDVLVNCAGILRSKLFEDMKLSEWNKMISINLTGTFLVSREAYKLMKENKGGVIINLSSDAGEIGSTMSSVDYSASKAGILGLTKSIAKEGARYGIRANAIAPGFIASDLLDKFEEYWGKAKLDETVEQIPMRRMGRADEVAKLAFYLASDAAAYITGATFDINGGSCMN